MNALQYKDGKFWLVPDVPEKPDYASMQYNYKKEFAYSEYERALDKSLSNSIEVAPECVELAEEILREHLYFVADELIAVEGTIYPIERLKYKVVEVNELLSSKQYQSPSNQNRDNAIIGYKKQVAIINK